MGIQGLLSKCKFEEFDIETYKYKNLGVDMYVLLHRFIGKDFAKELVEQPDLFIPKFYENIYRFLNSFIKFNYNLYLVYDGDKMNYKIAEYRREEMRNIMRKVAIETGDWTRCVDIVPAQMYNFHLYLKEHKLVDNFKFIVAPFEADAQLGYLFKKGIINSVLTVDSDLIVYGIDNILFLNTMDHGIRVYKRLEPVENPTCVNEIPKSKLWLFGYLIKCDYFKGISGIGIIRALNIVSKLKLKPVGVSDEIDWNDAFNSMKNLVINKNKLVEFDLKYFNVVRYVFSKQPVVDPVDNTLRYLDGTIITANNIDFGCITNYKEVSLGIYDPITRKPFTDSRINK